MVYVFGINLPLLELLLVLGIAVIVYLVLLELQFRKVIKIIRRLDREEKQIEGERKELEEETDELGKIVSKFKGHSSRRKAK